MIADAQVHIWEPESPLQPWPPGGRERAHRSALGPDEVLRTMDATGVERAILVPPSFANADNEYALEAARRHPDRFAVMGRIAAERPESLRSLEHWREQAGLLGFRLTLSRGASREWLDNQTLDPFWDACEAFGIPIYVLPPGILDKIRDVAVAHPRLKLIIDHLGLRTGAKDAEILTAVDEIFPLAAVPNIAVKATCLPSYVSEAFPFPTLQELIPRIVRAFGAERVLWGSDFSRLPCTYDENLRLFTEESGLSAEQLGWITGRSLSEWLDWPMPT